MPLNTNIVYCLIMVPLSVGAATLSEGCVCVFFLDKIPGHSCREVSDKKYIKVCPCGCYRDRSIGYIDKTGPSDFFTFISVYVIWRFFLLCSLFEVSRELELYTWCIMGWRQIWILLVPYKGGTFRKWHWNKRRKCWKQLVCINCGLLDALCYV